MRVDWQSSVEGIGGISMSEVVDVPTSQYVILAAAPRSMPSAEMTSYMPTYHYLRGPTPVAAASGNWHL
jgi:hypothetical protein